MKRLPEELLGRPTSPPEASSGGGSSPFLARAGLDPAAGPTPGEVAMLLRDRAARSSRWPTRALLLRGAACSGNLAQQCRGKSPALAELHAEFATSTGRARRSSRR